MFRTLNQSPGGRIFHFHNFFLISLKCVSIWFRVDPGSTLGRPRVDPKLAAQNIF